MYPRRPTRPLRMYGELFRASDSDSLVVVGTGATANLVCLCWPARRNRTLGRERYRKVSTYPSSARLRFGDGRLDEVRQTADIPAGIAESAGKFTPFALDAGFPALLRKDAWGVLGGEPDLPCDLSTFREQGMSISLRESWMGHYILSAVDFREDPSRKVIGPAVSAPRFEWAFTNKRPNLPEGGLNPPYAEDGLYQFEPRTLGDAMDGCPSDPKETIMKFHTNWGYTSEQQVERVLVYSGRDNMHLPTYVDEVSDK